MKIDRFASNMRTKKLLFYLLAVLLGSCVPSLHPLYTDKELVFEEKLLGTWVESDSDQKWEFKKGAEEKSYDLTVDDNGEKGEFAAHLVKIDKMLFLDLFPKEPELEANEFYKLHLLGVHTFMKIGQIEPTLKMRMMDPETMEEILESDPNLIKHEIVENQIVLTASTKELQEFMKKHANTEGLFGEPEELERLKPEEPNEPNDIDPNAVDPNEG